MRSTHWTISFIKRSTNHTQLQMKKKPWRPKLNKLRWYDLWSNSKRKPNRSDDINGWKRWELLQVQTLIFLIDIIINSLYIKPSAQFCLFFIFLSNLGIFNILWHWLVMTLEQYTIYHFSPVEAYLLWKYCWNMFSMCQLPSSIISIINYCKTYEHMN